jgi:hypothetical protein
MREYKLVSLNPKMQLSKAKELEQTEKIINEYASDGWILQQIITPADVVTAPILGLFYKEK